MTQPRITANLWAPLPDGRRLAAKPWLPPKPGPAPTILEYLPYRKRDGTAPRDATTHPVFAAAGYACIRVDIAGTGDSDGTFDDEYSEQELSDGEAVIAWIAAQDWCDGNIGMIGISWGGFNGLQLAYRRPPALKAVVSCCSTVDRYADDIHYMGGCLLTDNFNWGGQMTAYQTRPLDPELRPDWREEWLRRIETLPFSSADWLRESRRGAYWRHGSVCEDWRAIAAPVLAIGGWADAYVNAPFALAENLTAPVAALMGPWEHKYPHIARINPADFHGEVIGWFDRWLKGRPAPALPAMRAFIQDWSAPSPNYGPRPGRWVSEAVWPNPAAGTLTLFPAQGGALGASAGAGTATVRSPQTVGAASAYFCPGMRVENELAYDQRPDDAQSLCFDTAPMETPLEMLGRPEFEFAFSVDRPVAQLCLRLCEVAPDGASSRISYRTLNLCHHASHEHPAPLEPGKLYRARVALNALGRRIAAGRRLRLAISTAYWPVIWPSPDAATVTLHLDGCALTLPTRETGDEAAPPPAPRDFPRVDAETTRPAQSRTERRVEPDGAHMLETFDDFGETIDRETGLRIGAHVAQWFSVEPEDPLSARHVARWRYTFQRGDWRTAIDSENVMTCDGEAFILSRSVTAYDGDAVALEKTWRETIARDLI